MENMCNDSPMFDFVEQAAGKEVRVPLSAATSQAAPEVKHVPEGPSKADLVAQFAAEFNGDFGEIEFDDLNENVPISDLARMSLTV